MTGRRILAIVLIAAGAALAVLALLILTRAFDQSLLNGVLLAGLAQSSPAMILVLGAVTAAFGLLILVATFRRRE